MIVITGSSCDISQNFLEKKSSTANASALLYTDTPPVANWGGAIGAKP
jgi:hypothetical protein